ncbi:dTDP-4-dehydrorhamnose 3,5-epimerase [Labilibaculum sp. DW002]|uniref:dTDP-4-dehydrorhamnose 3,5-epimerase n=1 Tax=Paralabilibaculum antarcticum TaxID=2912572 RepID=A0ABT5VXF2_9BACT|nr:MULTISPECIES: dTDP-4-dehydrorhamnose 3,5-epimerase [unclassified Labilibaculum]MBI9059266.1 dTDP-4-dehydrorhamnose 3,5-epimerase [Labilibaculum sp.]MDE5419457.1 dTDP-4-dehydrorhamnose 3,5-epimerase [Labilibaculum sp. DW002]
MDIIKTKIPDLLIIKPKVFEDERGYFFESYNERVFHEKGIDLEFVQDNESKSGYGVIRGLHYQLAPYSQTKLVRVIEGKVFDVAVDLRQDSPTYGQWSGIELSAENKIQFLVPKGFAHGFSVLSKSATFIYKCDNLYNQEAERGIAYNDPSLNIDWRIQPGKEIISPKDRVLPNFREAEKNFKYSK